MVRTARLRSLALAALGAMLPACGAARPAPASQPAPLRLEEARRIVARIELCRTTAAELRQSFGEPMRDGRVRDGRVASWMLGRGHPERILAVLLDSHGVVVDIYWDVPGVGSWAPRDACRAGGGPGSPPTP